MRKRTRKNTRSTKQKKTEEEKKESLFDSHILNSREIKWLKNDNSELKCKITRQYLTEENILKWKPIPKSSKKVLKKLISKTLLK